MEKDKDDVDKEFLEMVFRDSYPESDQNLILQIDNAIRASMVIAGLDPDGVPNTEIRLYAMLMRSFAYELYDRGDMGYGILG